MPVNLSEPFSAQAEWILMAVKADQLLREYGYYNYEVLIRLATASELQRLARPDLDGLELTANFDQRECRLELVLAGLDSSALHAPFDDQSPEEFAEYCVVEMLDQFLIGDPLDPDDSSPGRTFRVVRGGKNS